MKDHKLTQDTSKRRTAIPGQEESRAPAAGLEALRLPEVASLVRSGIIKAGRIGKLKELHRAGPVRLEQTTSRTLTEKRAADLGESLKSPDFEKREMASKELKRDRRGIQVAAALLESPDAEVQRRAKEILRSHFGRQYKELHARAELSEILPAALHKLSDEFDSALRSKDRDQVLFFFGERLPQQAAVLHRLEGGTLQLLEANIPPGAVWAKNGSPSTLNKSQRELSARVRKAMLREYEAVGITSDGEGPSRADFGLQPRPDDE